jgi:hypothetical protein
VRTEDLIDFLAAGEEATKRRSLAARVALGLVAGLACAGVLLTGLLGGVRPDIGLKFLPVMLKAGFSAAACAIALPLLLRLAKPGRPMGWRLAALLGLGGLSLLVAIVALAGEAPEKRLQAWLGSGMPWCVVLIPVLAIPAAALLLWIVRPFAPTRLEHAGAAIGAAAGGVSAMVYAMYCPVDSVAFVATWYALGIAICAALGAWIGSKFLRW